MKCPSVFFGLASYRLDNVLGDLLGVSDQHHGVIAIEQRIVDAGAGRMSASA
jgi:hypothetical protein